MDRLISEKSVMEVIYGCDWFIDEEHAEVIKERIKAIPSAEPKIVPIAEVKIDDDMLHEIVEEAVKNIEIEPKWIPTNERLPEKDGEYLATVYDTDENYKYMDIAELEDGIWQYKDYIKVLAWMPLPKRYEPQERSE